ncbi:thiolase family protein [Arthrobacter sp. NPDC080031]|uniref:thiolase family protein n=1 Tax=Arthrobacter sp. NPDC080031 TaxID=3155918 RepID=UPI00344F25E4
MTASAIIGVGMTKFGKYIDTPLHTLAADAIDLALADAGVEIAEIDMVFAANAMASITTGQVCVVGQSVLRPYGFSSIPVFNVDNACAGSSSALSLAAQAIAAGEAKTVLVFGVEKLYSEDRTLAFRALNGAIDVPTFEATGIDAARGSAFVSSIYPQRLQAYKAKWGLDPMALAQVAVKNRSNAALNPQAQYTDAITTEDVLSARMVTEPLTTLMCAPIGDGASALVVTSADRAIGGRTVWLLASAIAMGGGEGSSIAYAANRAYRRAGIGPRDIDVAEVHDSVAFNELLAYEELGLCEPGQGTRMILDGETHLGGRIPVNTSGGLESRGHPVAATGGAQIIELVQQLRGEAGQRQVPDARIGVAENAGGYALNDTASIAITVLASDASHRMAS